MIVSRSLASVVTFLNVIFYNIYNLIIFILYFTECSGFSRAWMNRLSDTFWNNKYMHLSDVSYSYYFYSSLS